MDTQEFNALVKRESEREIATLTAKAKEYARGDRLSNFKQIASMLNCTPERALIGLVAKHWIALLDFISDIEKGIVQPMDRWDEKIGDIRAYMTLLKGQVTERLGSNAAKNQSPESQNDDQNDDNRIESKRWFVKFDDGPACYRKGRFFDLFLELREYAVVNGKHVVFKLGKPSNNLWTCLLKPNGTYQLEGDVPDWVRRSVIRAEQVAINTNYTELRGVDDGIPRFI